MIGKQTAALFLDAYRELNARKLFWLVMILSGLVVAIQGCLGINERGMSVLWWTLEIPGVNSTTFTPELFYKITFVNLGIGVWLAWIATVLALVSTASIIPDFIASGSIELTLSKPIGRMRLFATKYATGLMFVFLQVLTFTGASFLVIGFRGGAWEPGIFLAVPIMVLFYSYLFSVCVLLGMITRSTIAALLLTILVWFLIFIVNSADNIMLMIRAQADLRVQKHQEELVRTEDRLEGLRLDLEEKGGALPDDYADDEPDIADRRELGRIIERGERHLSRVEDGMEDQQRLVRNVTPWHRAVFAAKTALPKTQETIALLERWLVDLADLPQPEPDAAPQQDTDIAGLWRENTPSARLQVSDEEVSMELQERLRGRSEAWVIGTSLGFEAVMLLAAGWMFCRRDF